ncbi:MAG: hypothetical protein OMM_14640, partial [Candidatus Magnetoglobus multicellularis str. Araruama]
MERIGDLKYPLPDGEWWFASHRNHIGRIFNQFLNDIKVGDLVVAHSGLKIVGITEVTENLTYFYDNSKLEYSNWLKSVSWVDAERI